MFLCPGMIAFSIAVFFAGSSSVWFTGTMEPHLFTEVIILTVAAKVIHCILNIIGLFIIDYIFTLFRQYEFKACFVENFKVLFLKIKYPTFMKKFRYQ